MHKFHYDESFSKKAQKMDAEQIIRESQAMFSRTSGAARSKTKKKYNERVWDKASQGSNTIKRLKLNRREGVVKAKLITKKQFKPDKKLASRKNPGDKFRINSTNSSYSQPTQGITDFSKPNRRKIKARTLISVNTEKRSTQQLLWSERLKGIHEIKMKYVDQKIQNILENSPFQYYFRRILQVYPPSNACSKLLINRSTICENKPLLVIAYDGILGFSYVNQQIGVDWFLNTGKSQKIPTQHFPIANRDSFLMQISSFYNIAILMPEKTQQSVLISEEMNQTLQNYVSGYFGVIKKNKKTKTVDISDILHEFPHTDNVYFFCPLFTDTEMIRGRKHECLLDYNGTKMVDCKEIKIQELWDMPPLIPTSNFHVDTNISLVFAQHLYFDLSKQIKYNNKPIEYDYSAKIQQLSDFALKDYSGALEFLIPADYDEIEEFYAAESLLEHHAILKILTKVQYSEGN